MREVLAGGDHKCKYYTCIYININRATQKRTCFNYNNFIGNVLFCLSEETIILYYIILNDMNDMILYIYVYMYYIGHFVRCGEKVITLPDVLN